MKQHITVPIIDISPLSSDSSDAKLAVAQQIDLACRDSGFFYAANHDIDLQALQEVTTDRFFERITEYEKWRLAINAYNPANPRIRNGYYMAIEGKKANESYCYLNPSFTDQHSSILDKIPMHEVNIWPDETTYPGLKDFYEAYYWSVFKLSSVLLRGFSLALGKDENFFETYFTSVDTLSAVSLIRYPYMRSYPPVRTGTDGTKLSFEEHQDVSLITVLYQTPVPNLQVKTSDGYYYGIPTSGEYFLVNCGTYMSHITNNYYPAPVHRVAFINAARLSIPYFVNLSYDSKIEPFTPHDLEGTNHNKSISYGQYFKNAFRELIVTNGQT